ncbi:sensor histidine kinase [Microbacterium sp. SORGH_AS_0888]|uniref:sensor histidine kinase n=1 Tax=Microbacterium sp. SORGH_AS_0888 TaxID=3041791 RepID=UPI00277E8A4D|nr:histidine kinase [Microbacterium sp. SORGH_AS_0888]MDQ1128682.1 signal transduction histidine kinase [Microbacterium sp. SORGH_AS_0888]
MSVPDVPVSVGGRRPSAHARLVLPVAISLVVQVPAALWHAAVLARAAPAMTTVHVVLAIAGPLVLLAARRLPGPVVAVVSVFAVVDVLVVPGAGPPYVALAFAIVGAVARGALVWAAVAVGAGWSLVVIAASLTDREWRPPVVVGATLALAACFGIGTALRHREQRLRAAREAADRHRVQAEERERVRIARELHDVLGHALSQISVQAGVGLHLFDRDPEQARASLTHIRDAAGLALDDVRGVLGVLRDGEAPLAPAGDIDAVGDLVSRTRGPGLRVELDDRLGGARPSPATQLAAYRIVQEALTNSLRHSAASRVVVTLERSGEALVAAIEDDGVGVGAVGDGHGLRGMGERAALLGGDVEIGNAASGGARIIARLPWTENP